MKKYFLFLVLLLPVYTFSTEKNPKVTATIELTVGSRSGTNDFVVESDKHLQISMNNESLGFKIRLISIEEGNAWFEIVPTSNEISVSNVQLTIGKSLFLGKGMQIGDFILEKALAIKFLCIKEIIDQQY